MKLFHLSEKNLNGIILTPRIPNNVWTRNGKEEGKTPRISFSTSIIGALTGITGNLTDKVFFVHEIDESYSKPVIKKITNDYVPDQFLSKEVWVLNQVKLKMTKKIRVTDTFSKKYKQERGSMINNSYTWETVEREKGMNKVAMYKEAIYKEAKILVDDKIIERGDENIRSNVVVTNKPWYRSKNPKNYSDLVQEKIIETSPDEIGKIFHGKNREERIKAFLDIKQNVKKSPVSYVSYRAPRPLLFGKKKYDEMAKNLARMTTIMETSEGAIATANETKEGFLYPDKPKKIYRHYKQFGDPTWINSEKYPSVPLMLALDSESLNKQASYKEAIYKQAGVVGGALVGAIGGGIGGYKIGKGTGKLFNPRDAEMKALHSERDTLKEEESNTVKKYDKVFHPYNSDFAKDFNTYLNRHPKRDFLTVAQTEDLAQDFYRTQAAQRAAKLTTEKTASINFKNLANKAYQKHKKTLIGMGVGAALPFAFAAKEGYANVKRDNTDKDYVRKNNQEVRKKIDSFKKQIQNPKSVDMKKILGEYEHNGNYSPSMLIPSVGSIACEGDSYYGDIINETFKKQGKDYRDINWKDYTELVSQFYHNQTSPVIENPLEPPDDARNIVSNYLKSKK